MTLLSRGGNSEAVHLSGGSGRGGGSRGEGVEAPLIQITFIITLEFHLTMACITFETTFISARKARHSGTENRDEEKVVERRITEGLVQNSSICVCVCVSVCLCVCLSGSLISTIFVRF